MFKLIVVFSVLWLAIMFGIRRAHMLKGRVADLAVAASVAFVAASLTIGILAAIVNLSP